ncbi:MAG TPA: HAD-IA family hydrolase [Candidatus Polarisedimenticolaceae bacterium]|nr:HAD-IA family hydrolase [Candidatus Polarisedimenticolaceae bacterium]
MRDVRTLLFDAGGVLLDLDYDFLRRLLSLHACNPDTEDLSRAEAHARTEIHRRVRGGGRVGEAWRDYFRFVLGEVKAPREAFEEIIDHLWDAHRRFGLWTVAIPGTPEALRRLKEQGYRMAVISNAEGRVEQDLLSAGYDGLFETVVDSFVVGVEKPDPAIFAIALERIGAAPENALYLGDVPSVDVEGARSAGIAPVLLDRHDLYPDVDAPRVQSIEEFEAWLAGPN